MRFYTNKPTAPKGTHPTARIAAWCCAAALAACGQLVATPPNNAPSSAPNGMIDAALDALLPTQVLLLGEQHDAPDHQRRQQQVVQALAERGQLAAVVLEMVEQGAQTTGLPPNSDEPRVRTALSWSEANNSGGWTWASYGAVVMAAVRAGVPVIGGNLPRASMRRAMQEAALETTLPPQALAAQQDNIRQGHCGLLPEAQVAPMARIQIARDQTMALTATQAVRQDRTVLLIAGNQHVRRDLGVPLFLGTEVPHAVVAMQAGASAAPPGAQLTWTTPAVPEQDHCAALEKSWGKRPAAQ